MKEESKEDVVVVKEMKRCRWNCKQALGFNHTCLLLYIYVFNKILF